MYVIDVRSAAVSRWNWISSTPVQNTLCSEAKNSIAAAR
jgi:hypothetical protein